MEWLLGAALVALTIAFFIKRRQLKNALCQKSSLFHYAKQMRGADNALVIAILAREIANELMQRDAEQYKEKFERLYDKWKEIQAKDKSGKEAHLDVITSKYKSFLDFDELGTKPHVVYADGFSSHSDDDLWDLYENIHLYDALCCELDEDWCWNGCTISEKELEHLRGYCKRLSDTKLTAHLHKAREQLSLLESNNFEEAAHGEWLYETNDYLYKPVADVAESRWGVYVKSMDRYGMWGVFYGDDRIHTSFYAADKNFNEEYLDCLNIRICVDVREYKAIERQDLD
jgi:hypothetical protein